MKALSKLHAAPGLWLADVEVPRIGRTDVLIRIRKTAICGSDMHIWNWDALAQAHVPVPMIVGHEYAGEVVEVGADVQGLVVGDRVSGEGHLVCGRCKVCRSDEQHLCPHGKGVGSTYPGAFAEYLCLPARNAFKLPDEVSDDHGSILDPFGNAVHAAMAFEVATKDVLVTGAGPIGIMAAAVVQHIGARRVVLTDVNPYKLELARQMGIEHTVNGTEQRLPDLMAALGIDEGFDVGLEMSGAMSAFADQLAHVRSGGSVALFGLSGQPTIDFPLNAAVIKGLTLKGIYGRRMFQTWHQMMALIQSGLDVRPVITHRMKADDFQIGFDTMLSGQCGKVVLEWA